MNRAFKLPYSVLLLAVATAALAGCNLLPFGDGPRIAMETPKSQAPEMQLHLLNRVTWGANATSVQQIIVLGAERYLDQQLQPALRTPLAAGVQEQIDGMTIARPLDVLVRALEKQRLDANAIKDIEQQKLAQQAYQQELSRLEREAATRWLLRALYSPNQIQEKMTWFWINHFSIFRYKNNLRAMLGDYEENAIRPHALGSFRALLAAVTRHPAMLRYLDNEQNAVKRINENHARELMELHTLGVAGGFTQHDVQELARILTGAGLNFTPDTPKVQPNLQSHYVRQGLFEFNPHRHDYGDKTFLGQIIRGRGLAELDEALDRLARHPSTARLVSRKLALYFVSDDPPAQLIEGMARTFLASDGNIAATLRTMFQSQAFATSPGRKFKDPVHYVVSAVRLAYDEKRILNALPMISWLNYMGQPLFGRETPDGYPLTQSSWASPGQMTTRFEVARAIGSGSAGLFKTDGPQPVERAAFPQFSNALYFQTIQKTLGPATLKALDEARSPQEWNTYFLSSPEFMHR